MSAPTATKGAARKRPRLLSQTAVCLKAVACSYLMCCAQGYAPCQSSFAPRQPLNHHHHHRASRPNETCNAPPATASLRMAAASVKMRPSNKPSQAGSGGATTSAVLEELYSRRGGSSGAAAAAITSTVTSHEATVPYLSGDGAAAEAKLAAKVYMFDELGRADLLSHQQELELGRKIQQLVAMELIRERLAAALRRPPTDSEWAEACGYPREHRELFRAAYVECLGAKHTMVSANMRLVIAVAKRYGRMGVPLSDLVQEGALGLIRAAEKYDPSRGFKFSTYAAWWVQQAIFKAIAYHSRTIRLPVHVHNLLYNVRRTRKTLTLELGRAPTETELAHRVGVPLERLRKYLRASRKTISTDLPTGAPGFNQQEQVLGDTLEARDTVHPEESAEQLLFRRRLAEVMLALPEEERRVVTLRFGLEDGRTRSLAEIARASRVSKEWVRRTESRAMRKLRAPQQSQRLLQFYDMLPHRQGGQGGAAPR